MSCTGTLCVDKTEDVIIALVEVVESDIFDGV